MPKLAPRIVPVIGPSKKDAAIPLRLALAKVLRKVRMIDGNAPDDAALCALADKYCRKRKVPVRDVPIVEMEFAEPNPELDENIPF